MSYVICEDEGYFWWRGDDDEMMGPFKSHSEAEQDASNSEDYTREQAFRDFERYERFGGW